MEFIQQQFAVWKSVYHWSKRVNFHVYAQDLKVNAEGPAKYLSVLIYFYFSIDMYESLLNFVDVVFIRILD